MPVRQQPVQAYYTTGFTQVTGLSDSTQQALMDKDTQNQSSE